MTTPLISVQDIQAFKGISSNLNLTKDLEPHILEAQDFDLRPFVGESFYLEIVAAFPTLAAPYGDLWNGSKYTYQGNDYEHQGLKAVLAYHSYARYVSEGNVHSTPAGFVKKTNQFSEPVGEKTISRLIAQARSGATAHENRVLDYLIRNKELYPGFKCPGTENRYKTGVKIRNIG